MFYHRNDILARRLCYTYLSRLFSRLLAEGRYLHSRYNQSDPVKAMVYQFIMNIEHLLRGPGVPTLGFSKSSFLFRPQSKKNAFFYFGLKIFLEAWIKIPLPKLFANSLFIISHLFTLKNVGGVVILVIDTWPKWHF